MTEPVAVADRMRGANLADLLVEWLSTDEAASNAAAHEVTRRVVEGLTRINDDAEEPTE